MTKIKKVGVLSLAKIYAVTMGLFGLLMSLLGDLFTFLAVIVNGVGGFEPRGIELLNVITYTLFSFIFGFITGAIVALIYNLIASWVGGIEFEFDNQTKIEA